MLASTAFNADTVPLPLNNVVCLSIPLDVGLQRRMPTGASAFQKHQTLVLHCLLHASLQRIRLLPSASQQPLARRLAQGGKCHSDHRRGPSIVLMVPMPQR